MADRPQQTYPSMQGFNNGMNNMNNMLQQQQHNQQQQQQGGDMHPSQSFGGLWNQSMQQQPQFRPRSGAGMPPQNQAQMNEIMRSHNMARVPSGQQQPMNFSMGVPNMGNPLPFHDQPSNQPNMNGGAFGGMQNPAMQQQRQNNLLQSMPPGNVRQLEMMMQNPTSMNFAKLRPDQPQANQQPSFPNSGVNPNPQGDLFSSPSMSNVGIRGPSPSHPPNMNMMPIMPPNGNPIQAPQRRNLTSTEVGDRTNQLRLAVANQEATYNKIKSNPAFNSSAELQQRAKQIFDDLTQKKRYLSHMMQQAMNSQGNVAGQGVNPGANGWMAPPNPNAAGRPNGPPTPIPPQSSPHPTGAAQSPSLVKPQPPGPHQAGLPQRTEATPQPPSQGPQMGHIPQQPSGDAGPSGGPFQMSGQMNTPMNGAGPGMGQPNPNGMPNGGPGGMASINSSVIAQLIASIPPLEPGTFENSFKSFCARRNRPFNPQLLTIDNRQVDLQTLHAIVIQEGGAAKIEQRGAWDVVGGKLGFVQFPGNESEPSKSGPGVALQISTMYREYLQGFDTVYLSSTLESRNKANGLGIPNVPIVAAMFTGSVAPGGMGGPGGAAAMMQARARAQAQQMGQLVPLAYLSVAEMRSKNVPEQFIVAVEQHRAMLQRAHDDQTSYARGLRGPQQQPGPNNGLQQLGGPHQQQGPADAHQGNGMGPAGVQSPFGGPVQGGQGHMPNRGMPIGQNLIQGGMPNPMDRPQGSPFGQIPPASLPHQMPQQGMGQGPNPNHEQFQLAMAYISRVKTEFLNNSLPNMTSREVPPEQRVQFNATLEQLHRIMTENESKLPMFFMLLNNSDLIKKLILISCTVAHQRQLLSGGSNRHIVSLETMRNMYNEVSKIHEMCTNALRATSNRRQQQMAQQQLLQQNQMKQPHQPMQQGLGMPSPANLSGPDMQRGPVPTNLGPNIPPPPSSIPPPIGAQHTPNLANQALRTQALSLNQPPPPRRPQPQQKQVNGAPPQGISSPSPAPPANASTPTHNAPTPNTMGSPQIPKSPKVKAPVNKKPQRANQRRPSKSTPTTSGNNAPTPGSHASPETSTPVQAPATIKRPREDDQAVGPSPGPSGDNEGVANGPSPPKRPKLEPPSSSAMPPAPQLEKPGEPLKKGPEMASEVSHIKTPQQSTEFLEQMTKLLTDVSSEGQAGTSPEQFGNTLEMLLKSVGGETDVMSNGFEAFPNPPSPGGGQGLSFDDLFDFSNMAEDEDYKDTPDLIRSSSTNPSPESNNSEGDHGLPSSSVKLEPKTEDFSSDVMPSGLWKEIDGGEAAYFQSSDWKWDGQMSTVEQPWAIY